MAFMRPNKFDYDVRYNHKISLSIYMCMCGQDDTPVYDLNQQVDTPLCVTH